MYSVFLTVCGAFAFVCSLIPLPLPLPLLLTRLSNLPDTLMDDLNNIR